MKATTSTLSGMLLAVLSMALFANPACGVKNDKVEFAQQYAAELATEVERLLKTPLARINGNIECKLNPITLALHQLPSRAEWEERAKIKGAEGYYAQYQLARLDKGEKLPTEISYPIQTWKFGSTLATIFLPGEVVVDYSLRLKSELDSNTYPPGIKVSDQQMAELDLRRDRFHGDWNYGLLPRT